jgi:hypothetical protein
MYHTSYCIPYTTYGSATVPTQALYPGTRYSCTSATTVYRTTCHDVMPNMIVVFLTLRRPHFHRAGLKQFTVAIVHKITSILEDTRAASGSPSCSGLALMRLDAQRKRLRNMLRTGGKAEQQAPSPPIRLIARRIVRHERMQHACLPGFERQHHLHPPRRLCRATARAQVTFHARHCVRADGRREISGTNILHTEPARIVHVSTGNTPHAAILSIDVVQRDPNGAMPGRTFGAVILVPRDSVAGARWLCNQMGNVKIKGIAAVVGHDPPDSWAGGEMPNPLLSALVQVVQSQGVGLRVQRCCYVGGPRSCMENISRRCKVRENVHAACMVGRMVLGSIG